MEQKIKEDKKKLQQNPSYIQATGRRKEAVARVFLQEGSGKISVNDRSLESYFPRESLRILINQPLKLTSMENSFNIFAILDGGGISGQAVALRHGIARALVSFNESLRPVLKKAGLLTRDPRVKERKKYGRKRARRSFQYSKR